MGGSLKILLFGIVLGSGLVQKEIRSDDSCRKKFGFRYHFHDTPDVSGTRCEIPSGCFPEVFNDDSSKFLEAFVFNKWGELLFRTKDINDKWICNTDSNINFKADQYVYQISLLKPGKGKMDTVNISGTINILCIK